ncbi:RNA dependent RNA polymerase-domain-containing protein [Mycena crocata]|nr:RNA dependent RNA polymerase-domain-containing protein [Mycena crocata]
MGDIEMTPSQVAYSTLDASYPPEFWDEVSALNMDAQLPSTQGSSGSETAINSAATSLSDVVTASDTAAQSPRKLEQMLPKTPTKPTARFLESPRRPVNGSGSPSRSPRSMPSMAPPRGVASGSSSGNLFGSRPKRANPQTELPPSKIRKLSDRGIDCKATFPSRPTSSKSITPGGVKPVSNGPKPFSLPYLFSGNHGVHLEPFVVFHCAELQPELDRLQIARGVQWELVRGIKSGSWTSDLVKAKLDKFTGPNAAIAPQLRDIIFGGTSQKSCAPHEQALWEELDREVKATVENRSRGLGLMGEFEGVSNYFGGNIQCTIRLIYKGDGKEPDVRLEPLEMTRSNHLARELGSVSVIALRDDKNGALVRKWAARKFLFCGRVYVALPPKSGKVYLIETDENHGRKAQDWCGDQHRISYDEYIRKNNRMDLNDKQPFSKYLTRFNLYLSTSIPALEFSGDNVLFIDDEYADGWSKEMSPAAEMIMTDGCGFLNRAAAEEISSKMKYERVPVAYQGRIAGSKGLWVIHPTDESDIPRIWIRNSQKKIQLRLPPRAHRIFNLLAVSGPSSSVNLSAQSIIILANNGVPSDVFCALQEQGLKDLIAPLMDWHRPNATAYLWDAINNIGNVTRSRLQRLALGASRALGFEKRAYDDVNSRTTDDPNDDADLWELPHTGRNAFSGEPVKAPEAIMDLLQAGFDPRKSPFLSKKIHTVVKTTMETFLAKYRIPLTTSLEAYIIPDPSGELKEGEVFFKSSISPEGPLHEKVVVGRYPMREPSDMQKVSAVNIPALSMYLDVLVISIHGSRSLASLLAGGDTDGDEAIIIRDPAIVDPFGNQAFVPVPHTFQADNFEKQVQTVSEFGRRLEKMSIPEAQSTFQKELIAGLKDDNIGKYSQYHDCAVYEYGLDDPRTRRMAHMTATLLDASKTGLRLKAQVEEADQTEYAKFFPRPKCFDIKGGHTRKRKRGSFVLDILLAAGAVTKDELWVEFDKCAKEIIESQLTDEDIEEPYKRMEAAAAGVPAIAADLELLKARVEQSREEWMKQVGKLKRNDSLEQKTNRKKGPARQTDNVMLPVIRDFRQPLRSDGSSSILENLGVVDEIKTSYAFALSFPFGFSMAFQDVCEIKRKAEMKRGTFNRVATIDDAKSMGGPARRLFKHMGS